MQAISNLRVWVVTAEDDQGFSIINIIFLPLLQIRKKCRLYRDIVQIYMNIIYLDSEIYVNDERITGTEDSIPDVLSMGKITELPVTIPARSYAFLNFRPF